ncbi:ras guanine nucleotide exchange factor domain-containing protein [Chlamydoabsidia padenii]|nr:ras guanine nucleotide exchange factor domain-containing protein [Chlamydoabsidia padenii]
MLLASDTVNKDSIHLQTNTVLRAHHRTMMASLSKLILSSHASTYNPTEHTTKMLADGNELLMATRNFISTGESIPIQVQHVEPQLETRRVPSAANDSIGNNRGRTDRSKYTLDGDLADTIETYGNNLCESIDGIAKCINTYKQTIQTASSVDKRTTITLDSSRSSLSALLFTRFRNFSEQSGQFLTIFDDVDYTGFQSPELTELDMLRQKLYQDVGDLFCKLQVLTDEDVPLDNGAYISTEDVNQVKGTIEAICHCVDKLVFDPNIRQQNSDYSIYESSMPTTSGINDSSMSIHDGDDNDDDDMDNGSYYTDAAGTTVSFSSHHNQLGNDSSIKSDYRSESSETNTNSLHSTNRLSTTVGRNSISTLQRIPSTSPDHPRQSNAKLKKFFGDDIPALIPQTSSSVSDQYSTVAGGPPSVSMETTTSNSTKDEERPWYLQYDYEPSEIVFNMEGSVKGGTLLALVIRLTLHDYLDMNFINTFLLTYRSFCSSMELLKLLERRYTRPPPGGLTEHELDIWNNKKLKLIRLRVFNVLKNWLEQYYNEDDHVILDELLQFTTTTIRSTLQFSAEQLERLIKKRQEATGDGLKKMVLTLPTAPPLPILPRNRKKIRLLDIDPLEIARQMTIMDFKLYNSIRPVECLNKAWSKEAHVATNIKASIEYCNQVTSWVSDAILSQLEVKKRVILIKHWVQIAERCRQLNNFNTCMAILSAFDNSAVGRLKRTWEMVGARTLQILSHIRKLMGANRNFTEYRAIIHSVNPPCIPFLGIYLQDLTFIEDGNADYLKTSKDLINFAKRAKTAEVIREIQQYQSTYYQLTPVDELQKFIENNLKSTQDEEQLYNKSLELEPREREDEKITRLLQESGFL